MTAGSVLIAFADSMPTMMIALAITGIGIGPVIVNGYTLATERTPRGRSATVMTMMGSAVVVGQSAASCNRRRHRRGCRPCRSAVGAA